MDLAAVTASLAAVKRGLDELDARTRQHLAGCVQLRQSLAEQRAATIQLQQQAEVARGAVHAAEEQRADTAVLLQCCRDQAQLASGRRQQLQVRVSGTTPPQQQCCARVCARRPTPESMHACRTASACCAPS